MAAPDDLLLGETVLALGNPFGWAVGHSRISVPKRAACRRKICRWTCSNGATDRAINHGNSGGPLVNARVNSSASMSPCSTKSKAAGAGIGFAIPSGS